MDVVTTNAAKKIVRLHSITMTRNARTSPKRNLAEIQNAFLGDILCKYHRYVEPPHSAQWYDNRVAGRMVAGGGVRLAN